MENQFFEDMFEDLEEDLEFETFLQPSFEMNQTATNRRPQSLRHALADELPENELILVPRAFDVVGDIAIFSDFPKQLQSREQLIAETLLATHPHLKTVATKVSPHKGAYRVKEVRIIAGEQRTTTVHCESGVHLKLDVENCFFRPRLANERLRTAKQVKDGEDVLVLFSGIGVHPLIIAQHAKPKSITCVELNPHAHAFAMQNVRLNQQQDRITPIHGDVRKLRLDTTFDRIISAPLQDQNDLLDVAFKYAKNESIVHLYVLCDKTALPEEVTTHIKKRIKHSSILQVTKCGNISPSKIRVCIDLEVRRNHQFVTPYHILPECPSYIPFIPK